MKRIMFFVIALILIAVMAMPVLADTAPVSAEAQTEAVETEDGTKTAKAYAAAIAVGAAAVAKSNESIARQPEAESGIKSNTMLGLVFIETAIIYALIVGILIIFVL